MNMRVTLFKFFFFIVNNTIHDITSTIDKIINVILSFPVFGFFIISPLSSTISNIALFSSVYLFSTNLLSSTSWLYDTTKYIIFSLLGFIFPSL